MRPLTVDNPLVELVIDSWYGPGIRLDGTVKVICVSVQFAAVTGTNVLPSLNTPGEAAEPGALDDVRMPRVGRGVVERFVDTEEHVGLARVQQHTS